MAKIFANLILKHGNSADLDISKLQPCEPVFLTDTNKLVIKKLDGEIATFDNYKNIVKAIENKDYLTGYAILEDGTLQLMSGDKVIGDPLSIKAGIDGLTVEVDENEEEKTYTMNFYDGNGTLIASTPLPATGGSVYNTFNKSNLIEEINTKQTGYFTSANQSNQGNYDNGTYSITTSLDNTVRANWIFNSEVVTEKGSYYISFEYKTNSDFNLGVKIDNGYKDLGKIGAITDGNKHTYVAKVDVTSSLNLYEIYVPNITNVNVSITNIVVMNEFDFVKSYSNITEYLQTHDLSEATPEQFGAIGNGTFDDTIALQKAIDYCIANGKQLKCQNGKTYCISSPLNLSNTSICLINFNWATLKAIKTMDYMITFDGSANVKNDVKTLLKNIIIDCNNKAGGLNLIYSYKFTFENFMIKNCQTVAIWIQRGGAFVCQNGTIIGDCTPDSRGIYNQTSDCHFHEIVIIDMKKCIFNGGTNFYHKVHGWLTSKVANSIFFEHFAGFGSLVQCPM